MNTSTSLALLSSVRAQLDDLMTRITAIADEYATTPDSQIAAELFTAERSLRAAGRAVDRAADTMSRA